MTRNIITKCVYPSIPARDHDWCAYYDGEEERGGYGWGATEGGAIADLKVNHTGANEARPLRAELTIFEEPYGHRTITDISVMRALLGSPGKITADEVQRSLTYIDGLEAHLGEGGTVSSDNIADLIVIARKFVTASEAPVAFRVKDYADGWAFFLDQEKAKAMSDAMGGALMEDLFTRPSS